MKAIAAAKVFLMMDVESYRDVTIEEMEESSVYLINYHYHFKEQKGFKHRARKDPDNLQIAAVSGNTVDNTVEVLIPFSRVRVMELGYIKGDRFYSFGYPNVLANRKYSSAEEIRECLFVS